MGNPYLDDTAHIDDVAGLVDRSYGLISLVEEVSRRPGAPEFFHFRAQAANTGAFCDQRNFAHTGGASISRARARRKALGEAIERYCAAIYSVDEFPLYAYDESKVDSVHPQEFALYSEEQYATTDFPWRPFDTSTLARWVPAWDPIANRKVNVPACRVFVPYVYYPASGEVPIDQPISTGLACHESFESAAISALCEVVERDAFTIAWQARIPPARIGHADLPNTAKLAMQAFYDSGYRVDLFSIQLDVRIPTILAVLRGEPPKEHFAVLAAACAPGPEDAAVKCLEELAHTRHYCSVIKELIDRGTIAPREPKDVEDQVGHLGFYLYRENHRHLEFLYQSTETIGLLDLERATQSSPTATLRTLFERIAESGNRSLLVDVTSPDVARLGFHVIRAVVPGFHPLRMGHRVRALGGSRLRSVPKQLGYRTFAGDEDNPAPHPYP